MSLKILIIVLGVVALVLLGVFLFVPSAKSPVHQSQLPAVSTSTMGISTSTTSTSGSNMGAGNVNQHFSGPPAAPPPPAYSSDGSLMVYAPRTGGTIKSPENIVGTVTGGNWFFEGTFPVKILDGDGTVIGTGQAVASGDWTSGGTIPFTARVEFSTPKSTTGTILFTNDNPSGLLQNQKEFKLPIRFN